MLRLQLLLVVVLKHRGASAEGELDGLLKVRVQGLPRLLLHQQRCPHDLLALAVDLLRLLRHTCAQRELGVLERVLLRVPLQGQDQHVEVADDEAGLAEGALVQLLLEGRAQPRHDLQFWVRLRRLGLALSEQALGDLDVRNDASLALQLAGGQLRERGLDGVEHLPQLVHRDVPRLLRREDVCAGHLEHHGDDDLGDVLVVGGVGVVAHGDVAHARAKEHRATEGSDHDADRGPLRRRIVHEGEGGVEEEDGDAMDGESEVALAREELHDRHHQQGQGVAEGDAHQLLEVDEECGAAVIRDQERERRGDSRRVLHEDGARRVHADRVANQDGDGVHQEIDEGALREHEGCVEEVLELVHSDGADVRLGITASLPPPLVLEDGNIVRPLLKLDGPLRNGENKQTVWRNIVANVILALRGDFLELLAQHLLLRNDTPDARLDLLLLLCGDCTVLAKVGATLKNVHDLHVEIFQGLSQRLHECCMVVVESQLHEGGLHRIDVVLGVRHARVEAPVQLAHLCELSQVERLPERCIQVQLHPVHRPLQRRHLAEDLEAPRVWRRAAVVIDGVLEDHVHGSNDLLGIVVHMGDVEQRTGEECGRNGDDTTHNVRDHRHGSLAVPMKERDRDAGLVSADRGACVGIHEMQHEADRRAHAHHHRVHVRPRCEKQEEHPGQVHPCNGRAVVRILRALREQERQDVHVHDRKEGAGDALPRVLDRGARGAVEGEHRRLHHRGPHAEVGPRKNAAPSVRLHALFDPRRVVVHQDGIGVIPDVHLGAHHVRPADGHDPVADHRVLLPEERIRDIAREHGQAEQRHIHRNGQRHCGVGFETLVLVAELGDHPRHRRRRAALHVEQRGLVAGRIRVRLRHLSASGAASNRVG
mmetsp:Transcript_28614/g.81286  ORF Transcript_28614/g.81286 Transcript_28614/m.81286 type:complete len:879 (+) Transcript_28614:390-3026(+)